MFYPYYMRTREDYSEQLRIVNLVTHNRLVLGSNPSGPTTPLNAALKISRRLYIFAAQVLAVVGRAFGSSNQKQLPLLNSDSTPIFPPIRSTPRWTIASPIPVPG